MTNRTVAPEGGMIWRVRHRTLPCYLARRGWSIPELLLAGPAASPQRLRKPALYLVIGPPRLNDRDIQLGMRLRLQDGLGNRAPFAATVPPPERERAGCARRRRAAKRRDRIRMNVRDTVLQALIGAVMGPGSTPARAQSRSYQCGCPGPRPQRGL